jgi:hypothetical protein
MTNQYQRGTNAPSRKVVTYLFSMVGNAYTYNVYELIFSFVVWLSGLGAMFHYHRTRKLETLLLAWRSPLSIPLAHTIASLLARAFPSPATPSPHQRMPRRRNDNGEAVGTHTILARWSTLCLGDEPWWCCGAGGGDTNRKKPTYRMLNWSVSGGSWHATGTSLVVRT